MQLSLMIWIGILIFSDGFRYACKRTVMILVPTTSPRNQYQRARMDIMDWEFDYLSRTNHCSPSSPISPPQLYLQLTMSRAFIVLWATLPIANMNAYFHFRKEQDTPHHFPQIALSLADATTDSRTTQQIEDTPLPSKLYVGSPFQLHSPFETCYSFQIWWPDNVYQAWANVEYRSAGPYKVLKPRRRRDKTRMHTPEPSQ